MGAKTKLLVEAAEVAAHLADPSWRIFDCRHDLTHTEYGAQAYAKGHIPGAQFLHLDRDLSGPPNGRKGRHPLPDPNILAQKLSQCGVDADTQVVAYDNEGGIFAARLWWLMRWLGHSRVALLDGGLAGWKRAKLPLEDGLPLIAPAQFVARPGSGGDTPVDAAYVLAHPGLPDMLIDDAAREPLRGKREYRRRAHSRRDQPFLLRQSR